jgi:hypothetical protein
MPNIIQINSITGTSPYNIYVCDITLNYCFLVSGSTAINPVVRFAVPPPLDNVTEVILKIVDSLGCEKFTLLSCGVLYGKLFEDFAIFMFQDDSIYLYEGPP